MTSIHLSQAQNYSLRALLNSMLRDFSNKKELKLTDSELTIDSGDETIRIPLRFRSILGFHKYSDQLEATFENIVESIAKIFEGDREFVERVYSSSREMEQILSQQKGTMSNFLESEQNLLFGHPFHPFPKLKGNIEREDVFKYSPEYRNSFRLKWLRISPESLELVQNNDDLSLDKLKDFDLKKEGHWMPIHPLQESLVAQYGKEVSEGKNEWFACSSMRTLYCDGAPCFLKFSLPVKLTNSIRILNGNDLKRANVINQVFEDNRLESFFKRNPKFSVQLESTFGGLKKEGEWIDESIFQLRSPLNGQFDKSFLLASLCEGHFLRELILSSQENKDLPDGYRLKFWFTDFLSKTIKPILDLAFNEGILLGAHLQNLIVELTNGRVTGCEYRDCQGTGLSVEGKNKFSTSISEDALIISNEDINKVFGYYLVVNSIFSVISSLAQESNEDEIILVNELRSFFGKLKKVMPKGEFFFDYWINSKGVFQKGNFRCCVGSNDENTMNDPWAIYNEIENPLSLLRPLRKYGFDTLYEKVNPRNGKKLSLRKLELARDLDIFHEWHNKEFVSEFWELNKSKEELENYIQKLYDSHYQLPVIVELDGSPIGYFEIYRAFDDRIAPYAEPKVYDRGVHILIGEERVLRTRHVFDSLALLTEFCFKDDELTENLWAEPRADNRAIIKFAGGLPGWEVKHEFNFPHKRARLLKCNREKYREDTK